MDGKIVFPLSKPIKAHGKELTELELREPNGDDVEKIGFPYMVIVKGGAESGIEVRTALIYQYISRLAGIPRESAKQVSIADFSNLSGEIMGFFGASESEAESSSSS